MSAHIQRLMDQRTAAWADAQEIQQRAESNDELSAEDRETWERALDDVERLTGDIRLAERSAGLPSFGDSTVPPAAPAADLESRDDRYAAAFSAYLRNGGQNLSAEHRDLLATGFDPELRAQGTATGGAGGYTVPEGFWAKVTETMALFTGASVGAETITTSTGNDLPWPTNDDTANEGYFLGENTQTTSEGDLVFGQKKLGGHMSASGPILVSFQMLQDSGIDFDAYLARKIGERLARRQERAFAVGSGPGLPQGFVTGAATGKTTASATSGLDYKELVDLEFSVDAAYRQTGRCVWKMHDKLIGELRGIRVDGGGGAGTGLPLWQPSVIAGTPDTFLGYPIIPVNQMDSAHTTGKKVVAFGDFASAYAIRRVAGGQIMRLTERYADYFQVGFIGFERVDAVVQDASAVKLLVQA